MSTIWFPEEYKPTKQIKTMANCFILFAFIIGGIKVNNFKYTVNVLIISTLNNKQNP